MPTIFYIAKFYNIIYNELNIFHRSEKEDKICIVKTVELK